MCTLLPEFGHGLPQRPVCVCAQALVDGHFDNRNVGEFLPEHYSEGNEDAMIKAGAYKKFKNDMESNIFGDLPSKPLPSDPRFSVFGLKRARCPAYRMSL